MAPTRPRNKNGKSKARRKKRAAAGTRTAKQLMAEAMSSLEQGDVNAAAAAAADAVELIGQEAGGDNGSVNGSTGRRRQLAAALSLLGEIHLEMGDPDQAREFFLQAVQAEGDSIDEDDTNAADDEDALLMLGGNPTSSAIASSNRAEKFLWLAQLSEEGGADSVRWYERGAAELRAQIGRLDARIGSPMSASNPRPSQPPPRSSTTAEIAPPATTPAQRQAELLEEARRDRARRLASALCAVAEVYMTDLSWEADAEQRCEALVTEATMLAPDSAEAWQTVANVRISQGRGEDARAALQRSLEAWSDLGPEDPRVPAFASRVSLVRLLMEVEWEEKAVEVVERLAREDDESVEVLYLGGFGQFLLGEKLKKRTAKATEAAQEAEGPAEDDWRTLWKSSRRWLKQCLAQFAAQEYEDDRLGEHAQELLGLLNKELGEASPDDDDEDEGWEDADEDEDGDGDEEMKG